MKERHRKKIGGSRTKQQKHKKEIGRIKKGRRVKKRKNREMWKRDLKENELDLTYVKTILFFLLQQQQEQHLVQNNVKLKFARFTNLTNIFYVEDIIKNLFKMVYRHNVEKKNSGKDNLKAFIPENAYLCLSAGFFLSLFYLNLFKGVTEGKWLGKWKF